MDLVTGSMGSIGPKLLQLLGDEYNLQKSVKKEVKSLSVELESIHFALCKVAQVPWDRLDIQVKSWAREVRESSYDMEDVLDTFLVRVDGRPQPADPNRVKLLMKKIVNMLSLNKAKDRHDIAGAIEDINERLQELAERRAKYKVDEMVANPVTTASDIDPRLLSMHKKVTDLVGIGKAMSDIMSMLKITKMVSIVGIGGLGKTTLAKTSYDKLKPDYDYMAFVSVGRSPDLPKVFKDILFDLDKSGFKDIHNTGRDAELLIRELKEFLKDKRSLIVIDDVWEIPTWNWIESALVDSTCHSRVITTTRNVDVAKKAGDIYHMEPLSDDNSKELFYTRIGNDGADDELTVEATKKILKKCGGIPLSIITIASLLVDKHVEDWHTVYDSIGFRPEGKHEELIVDNVRKILLFSYYDLPPYLKTCLLYLSIYPEDHLIYKDDLIWQWVGQGFVKEEDGKVLLEVAETYLAELVNKSMIQPIMDHTSIDVNGPNGYRVHDMVLDMI